MVCYISMHIFPRDQQHIITMSVTFTAMMLLHIYYEALDINILNMHTVSMISFSKQMCLALCYKDGDEENIKKVTPREKAQAVKEIPSISVYLTYMFFVG